MYIEVLQDASGTITGCWIADTLPASGANKPLVTYSGGVPADHEQVRINVDTVMAMEIEEACKEKAVLDPEGNPVIQKLDRAKYIMDNFQVNQSKSIAIPTHVKMPPGMKMRELKHRGA